MNQPGFDFEAARRERDMGMQRAIDHADAVTEKWSERAYTELLRFVARQSDAFLSEDVRQFAHDAGLPQPPDARAWGSVMMRAARAGVIRKLGWTTAKDPKVHCNPVSSWCRV